MNDVGKDTAMTVRPATHRHAASIVGLLVSIAAMMISAGCGDSREPRVPVSGTVLVDGKRLAHGAIVFTPDRGVSGPRTGAAIVDDEYQTDPKLGAMIRRPATCVDRRAARRRRVRPELLVNMHFT